MSEKEANSQPDWMSVVSKYNFPDKWKGIWQLINSVVPFIALWMLMYFSLEISYWITLALAIPTTGFMVRIFIIFHDCGHRSYFKSRRANEIVGFFMGLPSFTAYRKWQRGHNTHHSTVGNLDKRGVGDVITMTIDEFKSSSKGRRLFYRLYRNPILMLGIGGPFIFLLQNRWFSKHSTRKDKLNIMFTNLVLVILITGISLLIGFKSFLLVHMPLLFLSTYAGTWLFYVQHQFEDVHWYRNEDWKYHEVALYGSSFYKLPRILQWFTGNIGFHHVHHLSSMIPNYKLEKCHRDNAIFSGIKPMRFFESLRSLKLRLWDEKTGKLVGFRNI